MRFFGFKLKEKLQNLQKLATKIWNLFCTSGSFRVAIQKTGCRQKCIALHVVLSRRVWDAYVKNFQGKCVRRSTSIAQRYALYSSYVQRTVRYCKRFTRPNNFVHCPNSRNRARTASDMHRVLPNFLFTHLRTCHIKHASNDAKY